jgi:hypothetical protein
MESTIDCLADFIKRYKTIANIRFTLGKYSDDFGFEKHLFHGEKYDRVLGLLNSNLKWDDHTQFTHEKNTKVTVKIIDTIIYKIENGPYDLIITAENKKCEDMYMSEDYVKKEINFLRKHHTFQVSHENNIDLGDIYSFNLLLHKNSNTDTYNSHSSILKIIDIINAIDNYKTNEYVFKKL